MSNYFQRAVNYLYKRYVEPNLSITKESASVKPQCVVSEFTSDWNQYVLRVAEERRKNPAAFESYVKHGPLETIDPSFLVKPGQVISDATNDWNRYLLDAMNRRKGKPSSYLMPKP